MQSDTQIGACFIYIASYYLYYMRIVFISLFSLYTCKLIDLNWAITDKLGSKSEFTLFPRKFNTYYEFVLEFGA